MRVTGWTYWGDENYIDLLSNPNEIKELIDEVDEAIIQELREKKYKFSGYFHQNDDKGVPIVDDKYIYCMSQRGWGDLIYRAFPEDDYAAYGRGYEYLKWAWNNNADAVYPE